MNGGPLRNGLMAAASVALGLVVSLGLIEVVPRLLPDLMPRKVKSVLRLYEARNSWESMMRGDRELGFTLRAGLDLSFPSEGRQIAIRTRPLDGGPAEIGFRDIGIEGPFDAVALGDSFTFCDDSTAEGCWVRRLSEQMGLRIATLGVNGYSNLAEARLLANVAPALPKVRLVLAGFFPNDFKDNLHFHNWTISGSDDDYWTWQRRNRRSDASEFLADWSVSWRLLDAARRYGGRGTVEHRDDRLDFVFTRDAWWKTVIRNPGRTPGFHLAEQAFENMARTAAAMDARLVVLLFPFKEQVYWPVVRGYFAADPELARLEESDIDAPFAALRASLAGRGIEVCDLTGPLREAARTRPQLYLRAGAHWTEEGNATAADIVAECLRRLGLPEGADRGTGAAAAENGTANGERRIP